MLKNAPTLAIVAVHTAEYEPLKISLVHFISSILSLTTVEMAEALALLTLGIARKKDTIGINFLKHGSFSAV